MAITEVQFQWGLKLGVNCFALDELEPLDSHWKERQSPIESNKTIFSEEPFISLIGLLQQQWAED